MLSANALVLAEAHGISRREEMRKGQSTVLEILAFIVCFVIGIFIATKLDPKYGMIIVAVLVVGIVIGLILTKKKK